MISKKKKKHNRYNDLIIIMVIIFVIITLKLCYIQLYKYDYYKELSNTGFIRQVPEPAPRGMILDSTGSILAKSKQNYMLVFIETEESIKHIYETLDKVFSILKETGESLQDDFPLKVEPYTLEFKSNDIETRKALELRFKKDRDFDKKIREQLYPKQKDDFTEEQKNKINEELLKIAPEEVFDKLIKDYKLYRLIGLTEVEVKDLAGGEIKNKLLEKYKIEELRRFMLVRDSIKMKSFMGYKPVVISSNIERSSAFTFYQKLDELPGIDISIQPTRIYPYNSLASAVIGYIGAVNSSQKEAYEERGYDVSSDMIGKSGIESVFEDRLRGSKGETAIKVNSQGRKIDELWRLEPYPGQNIQLTINKDIQNAAERSLEEAMDSLRRQGLTHDKIDARNATRGAAVAIDVRSGKVLAMVSSPSYDPNLFAVPGRLSKEQSLEYFRPDLEKFGKEYIAKMGLSKNIDELFPIDKRDPEKKMRSDKYDIHPKPFFNYATQGLTPPGSTFKPLVAVAGLESGVINKDTIIYDEGVFNKYKDLKDYKGACDIYNNNGGQTHGAVNVKKAIAESCNYFFFDVGYQLTQQYNNVDKLAEYAWRFGLGYKKGSNIKSTTGIEIDERSIGQTYDSTHNRELVAWSRVEQVSECLKNGFFGRGNTFSSINIYPDNNDIDEIKTSKDNIRKYIENLILSTGEKKIEFNEVKKEVKRLINEHVGLLNEEEKNKYDKKQIEAMTYGLTAYLIYDTIPNISAVYNVLNAAIGQGNNEFNLLQLGNYIATIANGGTRYRTYLVDKIFDANGNLLEETKPEVLDTIKMSEENYKAIREGMVLTTSEGTAKSAFEGFTIETAGKTGSATYKENGVQEKIGRTSYATYVGFAPANNPEIAVAVIIYDGGHGGWAAPVARAVYEEYFRDRLTKENYKFKTNYKLK